MEVAMVCFKVLSQNLLGWTEENYKISARMASLWYKNRNLEPPESEAGVLTAQPQH